MAISKGFFGHRRGSTKSFTYSVLNGKQVTREKAESVKNPRTYGQAYQRTKMATLTKAYRKMKEICDHSFENKQYGAQSMAYFLSANSHRELNFYNKKTDKFLPSEFLVSEGTLSRTNLFEVHDHNGTLNVDVDQKSKDILKDLGLSENGMFTIVFFDNNSKFKWIRFKNKKSDHEPASSATAEDMRKMFDVEGTSSDISVENNNITVKGITAFGVILSELDNKQWKRSTCQMVIVNDLDPDNEAAVKNYFGGGSTKVLNGGKKQGGNSAGGSGGSGGGGHEHP